MREKIYLSDLNILFICLSQKWETSERKCLSDACNFRNTGGSSFLLCREKSFLDKEGALEDIPRIYFNRELKNIGAKLNFYFQIQQILQKQQIDIIHTYSYDSLIPLGLILRPILQIPLIFTFNEDLSWKKDFFINRWAISRTDIVFVFSQNVRDLAEEKFPIHKKKIQLTGGGILYSTPYLVQETQSELIRLVTFVPRIESDMVNLKLFMEVIPPLIQKLKTLDKKREVLLFFSTDIPWGEHPLYQELKGIILERHLEMNVHFMTKKMGRSLFSEADIFIGLPRSELFVQEDLYALASGIPVVLPRTSTRQQITQQGWMGETYCPGDARELRDRLFQIIVNYSEYLSCIKTQHSELVFQHHQDDYAEKIFSSYEKIYAQRLRYTQKQKKLA